MYYCFLLEDDISNNFPLYIQCEYAKKLGCYCIASTKLQLAYDSTQHPIDLNGKDVLLRTTCENMSAGMRLMELLGATLIETEKDVDKIEKWYKLNLSLRQIQEVDLTDIVQNSSNVSLRKFLTERNIVFLKSKQKGFSCAVKTSRILNLDLEFLQYLLSECSKYGTQLIVSEYLQIKTDSMGSRESRHFVFNGKIINSSRTVHSIRHTVPKSHKEKAQEIVEHLKSLHDFPSNYVLDIGDFILRSGEIITDIIELNPITTSMSYVNNSIFLTVLPEIKGIYSRFIFGPEFCYDALLKPQNYYYDRIASKSYSFTSESRKDFL